MKFVALADILALVLASGCTERVFSNDLEGMTTSPTLRMHTSVEQRVDSTGAPTTLFRVSVARSVRPVGSSPSSDACVRDAEVLVGGEVMVPATFREGTSCGHYEAQLDHWITNVQVSAQHAGDRAEISQAEMLSDPDALNIKFPDQVSVGGAYSLRWAAQGRPVTVLPSVVRLDPPEGWSGIGSLGVEDGSVDLDPAAFWATGRYRINLLRFVSYDYIAGDEPEDPHVTMDAQSLWEKVVTAVPPPID